MPGVARGRLGLVAIVDDAVVGVLLFHRPHLPTVEIEAVVVERRHLGRALEALLEYVVGLGAGYHVLLPAAQNAVPADLRRRLEFDEHGERRSRSRCGIPPSEAEPLAAAGHFERVRDSPRYIHPSGTPY